MTERFFLALFTVDSWVEFLDNGGGVYGTTLNQRSRAENLHPGDILIAYISGLSAFSGLLRIQSESYNDRKPLWTRDIFPVRFKVEIIVALHPYSSIPVRNLRNDLSIFKNLKNEKRWAGFFITAFNEFTIEDGKLIEKLLKKRNESK